ncbi:MAG: T9SS type A sorting domain-containing protein [Methylococcales bacterium]|nr:T9SS type A sorting domain-containing protein [Methylococcales bacterium]
MLYNGTSAPQIHAGLTSLTNYFYKAFSYNGSTYSSGLSSTTNTFSIDDPASLAASPLSSSEISIAFAPNVVNNNVVFVWNNTGSFTTPSGIPPVVGQPLAGGIFLYNGITSPQLHSGLTPATNYYYRAYSFDGTNYSFGFDADATTSAAPSTFQLSVSISAGWNMVSVPGLHPIDQNVTTWWSGKDPAAGVFRFSGGYLSVSTTAPGQGYWMKNLGANTYNTGDEWPAGGINIVAHDPITAATGWNLIGGYETSVATSGITTTPAGLQSGSVFQYLGGYTVATNLVPGYGYWIKLTSAGQINIPTALSKSSAKFIETNKTVWGKIIVTDNSGKSYTLYNIKAEVNLNDYELPPAPPSGMFDVRYGSGRYAEDLESGNQSIEMQGIEYPVRVRVENMDIRLQDASGSGLNERLKSGEEVVISNSAISKLMILTDVIPDEYSLEQNYPNPFNPSTIISWLSPVDSRQIIKIYNILGSEIATLVNEYKPAGKYEISFDASALSSGIYFYTLQTGSFIETRKMILAK